jgi:hypothetical protein
MCLYRVRHFVLRWRRVARPIGNNIVWFLVPLHGEGKQVMTEFISEHPYVIYYLLGAMVAIIVYMYKKGKELEASALLHEIGKVAASIENMALEISRLFKRDQAKDNEIGKLQARMTGQETKCREREKICPGLARMIHLRDGDTVIHDHKRETNGD